MKRLYTNKHNLSLAFATFLCYDNYDYDPRPNAISTTSLIKPIRQIMLAIQNPAVEKEVDLSDLVPSVMGSCLHDGMENAWKCQKTRAKALACLGLEGISDRIIINPEKVHPGQIPVYFERRHEKEILGYLLTGRYDLVLDGRLSDTKSTSVWGYIFQSNDRQYQLQGSIYKWLAPEIITEPVMDIHYIFTDWSKSDSLRNKDYPDLRVKTKQYPLLSLEEIEAYITERLQLISSLMNTPQKDLPECTGEELWETKTLWKYFKNPKNKRATKNYDNPGDAYAHMSKDGNVGIVKEVKGQVKRCTYCNVFDVCTQKDRLISEGRLIIE